MSSIESSFKPNELKNIKFIFGTFDTDKSGTIDDKELRDALERIGEKVDARKVQQMIAETDIDKDGKINYEEFLHMVKKLREGGKSAMGDAYVKTAKIHSVSGEVGTHSYSSEETEAFVDFINSQLGSDEDMKGRGLPLPPQGLFDGVKDGVLLCKLINVAVPDTIDERVINKKAKLNPWERNENHHLSINSAKAIGCSTVNVGPEDLNEGRAHIVLGLVWQIIKIGLLKDISLKNHPELVRLLKEGETLEDLLKLPPEELLLRWVNYHLKEAGSQRRINNFGGDIKDSEAYTILLSRIAPNGECNTTPLNESDPSKRAELMLSEADKIGCRKFVSARDVVGGNPKLNLAFVANLFNNYPALDPVTDFDFAGMLDFDEEGTREERAFRFWIQSLGVDCNNLFEDAKDGLLLLKVEDKVQPGVIDWKKVEQTPKNKFAKVGNCNYAVDTAKAMKLSIVNIGGTDIHDGNKKMLLAIVWQLMRQQLFNILTQLGGGKKIEEEDLLNWANSQVGDCKIDSFKDPSMRTCVFFCKLCAAVAPRSVNTDMITAGETDEDATQNAKYALSVARKLNAPVFCLWEDLVEVKSKMILSYVGSLMIVAKRGVEH